VGKSADAICRKMGTKTEKENEENEGRGKI
jgi:hypothetical protein